MLLYVQLWVITTFTPFIMKHIALLLAILAIPSFAFTVQVKERETPVGTIQYFTVKDWNRTCLLDFNKTTQTALFSICF